MGKENRNLDFVLPMIEHALQSNPDEHHFQLSMGEIKFGLGEVDEAVSYLEASLDLPPADGHFVDAAKTLASAHLANQRNSDAIAVLTDAIARKPAGSAMDARFEILETMLNELSAPQDAAEE